MGSVWGIDGPRKEKPSSLKQLLGKGILGRFGADWRLCPGPGANRALEGSRDVPGLFWGRSWDLWGQPCPFLPPDRGHSIPSSVASEHPALHGWGCVGKGWGALPCPRGHPRSGVTPSSCPPGLQLCCFALLPEGQGWMQELHVAELAELPEPGSRLHTKVCSRICTAVNNYHWFL